MRYLKNKLLKKSIVLAVITSSLMIVILPASASAASNNYLQVEAKVGSSINNDFDYIFSVANLVLIIGIYLVFKNKRKSKDKDLS